MSDIEEPPISHIALSLSGGGFRSAGFHIGVLTALQRVGLLSQVRVLSTASGGSLVGARWLLGLARDEPFEETQYKLCRFLLETRALPSAVRRAAKERLTVTQGFAEVLEDSLFDDSRFSSATLREILESRIHVEEGSFNATVCDTGLPFRFTFSRGSSAKIGNQNYYLPRKFAQHLRMSDIVAASAAFPGAFEPMVVPNDFTFPDAELATSASQSFTGGPQGLMDGGVHDNQGISAMLLAAKRFDGGPGPETIDLYLVSDAERRLQPPVARVPKKKSRWIPMLRIWHVSALSWLSILGAGAAIYLIWRKVLAERAINDFRWPNDAIAFGVPIGMCVVLVLWLLYTRHVVSKVLRPIKAHVGNRAWRTLKRLRVRDAVEGLQTRAKTLEGVAAFSFPQRVRSLIYQSVWGNSQLNGRRVACHIYELQEQVFQHVDGLYDPKPALLQCVKRASRLPMGLEFSAPDELNDLQVTGQATTIANLIEYLEGTHGRVRSRWPLGVLELDGLLREDWEALNSTGKPLRPRAVDSRGR